jgi:hypothetical protein
MTTIHISNIRGLPAALLAMLRGDEKAMRAALADDALDDHPTTVAQLAAAVEVVD